MGTCSLLNPDLRMLIGPSYFLLLGLQSCDSRCQSLNVTAQEKQKNETKQFPKDRTSPYLLHLQGQNKRKTHMQSWSTDIAEGWRILLESALRKHQRPCLGELKPLSPKVKTCPARLDQLFSQDLSIYLPREEKFVTELRSLEIQV